jgi:hypothetical protein
VRRESVRDYCSCPRLGSKEIASLGRRGLDLSRAYQSLRFVLRMFSSHVKEHWDTSNYGTRQQRTSNRLVIIYVSIFLIIITSIHI